ncbi:MAG TPA: peptidoglycan DD-metalloendopeptidase family protein [Gammaproteobacteria bacterium]|nr:peptidoglycan DD-metalloendopeptidase family protein [Gammaproteobacteria bacterium]
MSHTSRRSRHRYRALPAALLAAALLAAPALAAGGTHARLEQHRKQLQELRQRIEGVKKHLGADRSRRGKLSRELEKLEKSIGQASKRLHHLDHRIHAQSARLSALQAKERKREADLRSDRAALARQIRAAYMAGREPRLKMLLNQENPAALGRMMVYYDYFNAERTRRIHALTRKLAALHQLQQQVAHQKAHLASLRRRQKQSLAGLEHTRHQRKALLGRISRRIHTRHQKLAHMQADEQHLQSLIRQLQDALANVPEHLGGHVAFRKLRGKLRWPVRGRIVEHYGAPRRYGQLRWNGVLIRAPRGTPVKAISRARVAFADWLPHYGLTIILEHGNGYLSLYGHNQALYKEAGDQVKAGETIATVGDTGGESRPALYFEIRKGKKPLDPQKWCRVKTASK